MSNDVLLIGRIWRQSPAFSGAQHIPYPIFTRRTSELDSSVPTVLYCSRGIRAWHAVGLLRRAGFTQAWGLRGGLAAWRAS